MAEVKATHSFSYQDGDFVATVEEGQLFDDKDPAVIGRGDYFEPTEPVKRGPGRPPKQRD